jgi:hypothetical protein
LQDSLVAGTSLGLQFVEVAQPGAQFDGFADWKWGQLVAYAFAELVALPHYEWLRWRDDSRDEGRWAEHGAVRIRRPRRRFPFLWTPP